MRFFLTTVFLARLVAALPTSQVPLLRHADSNRTVSAALFSELEELARIVDISYCVGLTGTGISKPFQCLSRCSDFPAFQLITTWSTGQLMSDSCGYIALDHSPTRPRVIVAFRGTYSIANTVVDLSTIHQDYAPYLGEPDDNADLPKCHNCTVHAGFYNSWNVTSEVIVPHIHAALWTYPRYQLTLVGHSLGGAVAALAGLDFASRGWDPVVTTFGEPRLGNKALNEYMDARFNIPSNATSTLFTGEADSNEQALRYRRVTHVDDPVPLLPLSEWGYRMHAGEIYISKAALSPDITDLQHCFGDEDTACIASQDPSLSVSSGDGALAKRNVVEEAMSLRDAVVEAEAEAEAEISDRVSTTAWGVPTRYKLWQLFFAHRDYFWRLGLCVPGGDPWDWRREKYEEYSEEL